MNKNKKGIMSNVSERDKKLLFIFGSILILAGSYFLVFSPNQQKSSEIEQENTDLSAYITQLDGLIVNEETKKQEIQSFNQKRETMLAKFPCGMSYQKAIATIADLEEVTEFFSSQDTFSVNNVFFDQASEKVNGTLVIPDEIDMTSAYALQGTSEQVYPDLMGYKTTVTVSFSCTDKQLSDALDYINEHEEKMSVESITAGYDESSGNLTGSMNICMYALNGIADKVYEEPELPDISLGVVNIFGSKEVKSSKKKK